MVKPGNLSELSVGLVSISDRASSNVYEDLGIPCLKSWLGRAVISPFTEKEGMEQPLLHWTPSIAPSDMIYYENDLYPEFTNSFLVTALVSKDVKKVVFDNGKGYQKSLFSDLKQRLRNIEASPAGVIYLLTDGPDGKLIKVLPKK